MFYGIRADRRKRKMKTNHNPKPDILNVIQAEGVELKRRGHSLWALCPFHPEKTPSFCIDQERQRWKCYGCGASGDVIDFVTKYKGLSFPDALKYLGISGGKQVKQNSQEIRKRELIEKFKEWCCNYTKYLCERLRLCNRIDSIVKTPGDLGLKGLSEMYLLRDVCRYHLSILNGKDGEAKFELYKEVRNGRRF